VLYIIFLGFKKYHILSQKPKGLVFDFIDKRLFTVKMGQNLYFIPLRAIYYGSITHSDVVHKFLIVLKNIEFRLKTQLS
jgi:hypothetical protein